MRKYFIRVFIPALAIVLLITSSVYRLHYSNIKGDLIEENEDLTESTIDDVSLRFISAGKGLRGLLRDLERDRELDSAFFQRDMVRYIQSRPEVMQIRYLDTLGFEILRYNQVGDSIIKIPKNRLQDKSNRPYFFTNKDLPAKTIALSSIELNREYGRVEFPYVLVARWIAPVFGENGVKKGSIVVNVNIKTLLDQTSLVNPKVAKQIMVLTHDSAIYYQNHIYYGEGVDSIETYLGLQDWGSELTQTTQTSVVSHETPEMIQAFLRKNLQLQDLTLHYNAGVKPVLVISVLPKDEFVRTVHHNLPYLMTMQCGLICIIIFFSYRWAKFRKLEEYSYRELIKTNSALIQSENELKAARKELERIVSMQEIEILEKQELLSALFDSSNHYAGVMDIDGKLIDVNNKTLETLGITKEAIKNKYIWDFDSFGDKTEVKKRMVEAMNYVAQGNVLNYDAVMRDKDGLKRRVAFSLTPLFNNKGEVTNLIPEGVDITELHEKDVQLRALVDQMTNRNKQLKEFSHIISHNVRSPIGNLGLLLSIIDDAETEEEKNMILDKLKEVNTSLQHLLEELLETVKILDDSEIKTEFVDVETSILHAEQLLSSQIQEANALINYQVDEVPKVYFPKIYFNSLILNLMSNAIKYRSDHRTLTIDIQFTLNKEGRPVMTFTDNGSGIDMNRHGSKIFGLYKTFHREKPGKGLGLFMTKTQIESNGGSIQVKSKLDEGTSFIVVFPQLPNKQVS